MGKFVEFFGPGVAQLSIADRATIANMCPEYGATAAFFPVDNVSIQYLEQTGECQVAHSEYGMYGFVWKCKGVFWNVRNRFLCHIVTTSNLFHTVLACNVFSCQSNHGHVMEVLGCIQFCQKGLLPAVVFPRTQGESPICLDVRLLPNLVKFCSKLSEARVLMPSFDHSVFLPSSNGHKMLASSIKCI